ncbi:unnamed protein product [Schistosoma intercalatum]|nr:unnamed protein product [Schistosoma intercalatum]CAH8528893.1 unnamed protein product [Schistosoma intercalatum]
MLLPDPITLLIVTDNQHIDEITLDHVYERKQELIVHRSYTTTKQMDDLLRKHTNGVTVDREVNRLQRPDTIYKDWA